MLGNLLTQEDCQQCKLCCKFKPAELVEAPLFTTAQKNLVLTKINPNVQFLPVGQLWRIQLVKLPDQDKYLCPVLEENKGCQLGADRPFDCRIYPYLIMRTSPTKLAISVVTTCPIFNAHSTEKLQAFLAHSLKAKILETMQTMPELAMDYYDNTRILEQLDQP